MKIRLRMTDPAKETPEVRRWLDDLERQLAIDRARWETFQVELAVFGVAYLPGVGDVTAKNSRDTR